MDSELRDRLVRVEAKVDVLEQRQERFEAQTRSDLHAINEKLDKIAAILQDRDGLVRGALWVAGIVGAAIVTLWEWVAKHVRL